MVCTSETQLGFNAALLSWSRWVGRWTRLNGPGGDHVVTSTACVDKDVLLHALAKFPTGVAIVTTLDGAGRRWGFTASAFTSLSPDPPRC